MSFNLFNDNLKIDLMGKITKKNQNLSFREAFRYAVTNNPTFPILAKDSPFPFDLDRYGGYFEPIGLFSAYNPIAMLELNERTNDINSHLYSSRITYHLTKKLMVGTVFAGNKYSFENIEFGRETSLFLGRKNASNIPVGFGRFSSGDNEFVYSDTYLSYVLKSNQYELKIKGGYSFQDFNYSTSSFSYDWPDLSSIFQAESTISGNKLISFYNHVDFNRGEKLFFNLGLRYEGSSTLPAESKWQFYPSFQVAYDIGNITNIATNNLFLSGGFGMSRVKT